MNNVYLNAVLYRKPLLLRLPPAPTPINPGKQGGEKEEEEVRGCPAVRMKRGRGEIMATPRSRNLQTHRQPPACRRSWTILSGTSAREGRLEGLFHYLCRCA